jgi:alginate O-acetyltransferase complex protein AlgI
MLASLPWFQDARAWFEPATRADFGTIFTTYWFVVFAGLVLPAFWLLRRPALRLPFLALACVTYHYHFAGPAGMVPIIALGALTYALGLTRNRLACATGVAVSVLALCFYKYTHFLTAELLAYLNPAWGRAAERSLGGLLPSAPPLAISFFAFEFIHYLVDVRQGKAPIRHPLQFVLFSIFFPSLVAGPIKRYEQFLPSLAQGARAVNGDDVSAGLRRLAMGLLKKVVVADNLILAIDFYTPLPRFAALSLAARWLVFALIALRILFDFSGYSDIAIGLARMLGVTLPENFNWPYAATNLQEFWQRWHISLSSWIRDYVYIPLGGNRHGIPRRSLNGLIAFALIGLWHGPAWHFVLWGLYHGIGLALCVNYAACPALGSPLARFFGRQPAAGWLATQLFAWFGWLIFFFPVAAASRMGVMLFIPGP